jgi:hypothetical protein
VRSKPFGFVQTIAPDRQTGENDVLPIAPFETDVRKSMKLQWVDFNSGDPIRLDWHCTGMGGTIGVMRLTERGWRKIIKIRPNSKGTTVERIREVAALYRSRSD